MPGQHLIYCEKVKNFIKWGYVINLKIWAHIDLFKNYKILEGSLLGTPNGGGVQKKWGFKGFWRVRVNLSFHFIKLKKKLFN